MLELPFLGFHSFSKYLLLNETLVYSDRKVGVCWVQHGSLLSPIMETALTLVLIASAHEVPPEIKEFEWITLLAFSLWDS